MKYWGLLFCLLVLGCSGQPNDGTEPSPGSVEFVKTLNVPGVIVMVDRPGGSASTLAMNLLDPRTNTRSAMQYPIRQPVGRRLPVDVSRDGQRIAHITPGGAVLVTRVTEEAGAPGLELVQSFEGIGEPIDLAFNAYGDRVATDLRWLNVETGEVTECDPGGLTSQIEILPDGYHYRCGPSIYRDGVLVVETINPEFWGKIDVPFVSRPASADGQLLSPSIALEPFVFKYVPPFGALGELGFPAWDGTNWSSEAVVHGEYLGSATGVDQDGLASDVCVPVSSDARATVSIRADPIETYLEGSLVAEETIWPLEEALAEYYLREESQLVSPLGVHPGTNEVVYVVTTRVKGRAMARGALCPNPAVESFLVAISPSGETRAYDMLAEFDRPGAPMESSRTPWLQNGPLRDYGMLNLPDGDFLLPTKNRIDLFTAGRTEHSFLGYVGGEPARVFGVSVNSEGTAVLNDEFIEDEYKICERRLGGDRVTRCMPGDALGRPLWVAAEGVMSNDTISKPLVRGLSHTARPAGATLTIWGAGFNNAGSIEIGDVSIPSTAAMLWTDNRIDIVVTEDWPERGILRVESGGNRSGQGGLERWFRRTPAISTPLHSIPEPLELRQGLNRFDLGVTGLLSLEPDEDGLYTLFSEGADERFENFRTFDDNEYLRVVRTVTFDEPVATDTWSPVAIASSESPDVPPKGVAWLGGELLALDDRRRPRIAESGRVVLDEVFSTALDVQNPKGIPTHFREGDVGAFSADQVFQNRPTLITGWEMIPLMATTVQPEGIAVPARDFGISGSLVVATSPSLMGADTPAIQVSTSGGMSFAPPVEISTFLTNLAGVEVDGSPAVLGFTLDIPPLPKLIDSAGIVTDAVLSVDDAASAIPTREGRVYTSGPVAIYLKPGVSSSQAAIVDMSAAAPALVPMTFDAPLYSLYHDRPAERLYAVLDDGTVLEAEFSGAMPQFEPVEFAIELTDGSTLQPRHVLKLDDGRWLVRAKTDNPPAWLARRSDGSAWVVAPD